MNDNNTMVETSEEAAAAAAEEVDEDEGYSSHEEDAQEDDPDARGDDDHHEYKDDGDDHKESTKLTHNRVTNSGATLNNRIYNGDHEAVSRSQQQQRDLAAREAVSATICFLCSQADAAEDRAFQFRQQAQQLANQFQLPLLSTTAKLHPHNSSEQQRLQLATEALPYKGKKRGRKPKPRLRMSNPNRRKRQHTGYTLFVQINHPKIKAQQQLSSTKLANAQIVSMVAKQWRALSETERQQWQDRAKATHSLNRTINDENGGGDCRQESTAFSQQQGAPPTPLPPQQDQEETSYPEEEDNVDEGEEDNDDDGTNEGDNHNNMPSLGLTAAAPTAAAATNQQTAPARKNTTRAK